MLATMESLGFVERDPQTGLYSLGLQLVTLAGVALNQLEVRRQAVAELAATSISGPLSALDLDHREDQLAARVIEMADIISHRLGLVTIPSSAAIARQPDARAQQPVGSRS